MDSVLMTPPVTGAESRPAFSAGLAPFPPAPPTDSEPIAQGLVCFHCGSLCGETRLDRDGQSFCCQGCVTVFEILSANGLTDFYHMSDKAGVRVEGGGKRDGHFKFLDEPAVRARLVDYSDAKLTRITLHLPAIHCIACVWLLENLFRIKAGIGETRVNFPRREVAISFATDRVQLSEVAGVLGSLGYEPDLNLADLEERPRRMARRLWLQLGLAGFAFGNTMFLSIANYCGLDAFSGPSFRRLTGIISLALALPVVTYSALDYWRSAWVSLRRQLLNIDVPIAAGLVALFAQSTHDVITGRGDGYFDSLCGLIFFLLCGRLFQQKTYERLAFDRDYKAFFPLSVTRIEPATNADPKAAASTTPSPGHEQRVALAQLAVGDRVRLRNGELIPADARLIAGPALIDYSFVTGESQAVQKLAGDLLYAGGRQLGGAIEVETVKAVSQSYLTSLWNQEAFRKIRTSSFQDLTNRYSQRFTRLVIVIALGAALVWGFIDSSVSLKAFTSVLIVACPCALALAAPFALGAGQRLLARRGIYLKDSRVIETLSRVDSVVLDKTGTLTAAGAGPSGVGFEGSPLSSAERCWLYSLTRHSNHPQAVRLGAALAAEDQIPPLVRSFAEFPGCGMEGIVDAHLIRAGSAAWLWTHRVMVPVHRELSGSAVYVAIDGVYRGCFRLAHALRPGMNQLLEELPSGCEVAVLSGDHEGERSKCEGLFGARAELRFGQSPLDKLAYVQQRQADHRVALMAGDGLNDAGALRQSDVGVAVVENLSAFSPASDVIMAGTMVPRLGAVLHYARDIVRIIRASFAVSAVYNVAGIAIAAQGRLSPLVCAILMPLSSATVVSFATGLATWRARRRLPPPTSKQFNPAPVSSSLRP